jgi:hypothetical protein
MPDQPQQLLDVIDRLTDRCVEDRILCVDLMEGTLNTFFPRKTLRDQIEN